MQNCLILVLQKMDLLATNPMFQLVLWYLRLCDT
jgi:hypothetical protein